MNRKIKFRAKRIKRGKRSSWVYGDLHHISIGFQICKSDHKHGFAGPVDNTTTGQFIGLYDQRGKEIYEGDYLSIIYKYDDIVNGGVVPDQDCICNGVVVYMPEFACYGLRLHKTEYPLLESFRENPYLTLPLIEFDLEADGIEVLGNIYDNPELLNK